MIFPFISFSGRCSGAISFYEKALNAKDKRVMYFKDAPPNPDFPIPDHMKDYVLHAEMTISGTKVSFSDTMEGVVPGNMISLGLSFRTVDEVKDAFQKLKEGGEVLMDLSPQFYSPMYGWVKDKFGVNWQIICIE